MIIKEKRSRDIEENTLKKSSYLMKKFGRLFDIISVCMNDYIGKRSTCIKKTASSGGSNNNTRFFLYLGKKSDDESLEEDFGPGCFQVLAATENATTQAPGYLELVLFASYRKCNFLQALRVFSEHDN